MIVLARHGDTFESQDRVVWVGARTDLPLAMEGYRQARRVALFLRERQVLLKTVVAGPLRRTRGFAEIVAEDFGVPVLVEPRLRELDYGEWEGLTSDMIKTSFGEGHLKAWEEELIWPNNAGWGEGPQEVRTRIHKVLESLLNLHSPVFACTSNGILRFVRNIIDGERSASRSKVRTGAVCLLQANGSRLEILEWDTRP